MGTALAKDRMQWVDAMRGFSMIIVVLGHVFLSMGIGGYSSFISSTLLTFRMPLFFFVSGFFSFRLIGWWTRSRVFDILRRKIQAQVLCTILFLSLFQIVNLGTVNLYNGFGGYWFTIVLFQMYLIYLSLSLISRIIHRNIVIPCLLIISALGIASLAVYDRSSWIWNFLCMENLAKYMQFFTLGIIFSKYRDRLLRVLDNNLFITITVIGWIVCMLLWYNTGLKNAQPILYSFIHDIAVRYFALMTVVMMFYSSRDTFVRDTPCSRVLQFIGQRTLDIYMIHYFLIPDLSIMSGWLHDDNMIVLQVGIGLIVSAGIIAVCMLISSILRKSKYLEIWLFGVKQRKSA